MDTSHRQEQFANAFLLAVSAVAGFSTAKPTVDNDSVDFTISSRLPRRPKIDIQMKSTGGDDGTGSAIRYPLKRKNYDDLILKDLSCPRLLVLVVVPPDIADWCEQTPDQLALRRCAYWCSLAGYPATANITSVTVEVPRSNALTVPVLWNLMQRASDGVEL